ncbi:MAG: YdcF family protein [Bacteroidetes bacterium]|nr:YdcF family protein [Bacteroidota bacterium]
MKRAYWFALVILLAVAATGVAQEKRPDAHYKLLNGGDFVQSKNYYLLTLFHELPDVKQLLAADPIIAAIGSGKLDSLKAALQNCQRDGACYVNVMRWSPAEIAQVADRLKALYRPDNALGRLVRKHLIPSGTYVLFQHLSEPEMLARAWTQDAEGINFAIGVYAEGKKPNYRNIASLSLNVHDSKDSRKYRLGYIGLLYNTASLLVTENEPGSDFFRIPLQSALHFLEMNERDQAADYEPMQQTENKAALDRMATIKWNNYPYTVIEIPGAGPDEPGVALSAEGMIRCRLAAIQYQKGLAPFIVTSGGRVHPYKTKYCEAIEMKKFLVEKLHVPANAILIDPHARHTTTNMRNTVRLIYRYGMPFDKAAITCTSRGQSASIEKNQIERCMRELNEAPFANGKRLSETEMEFYPKVEALQINPREPMDP